MTGVGGEAVGEVDHGSRTRAGQRPALGEPRLWAAVASHQRVRPPRPPVQDREARPRGTQGPGDAHEIAGTRGVASDHLLLVGRPADHRHGDGQRRAGRDVAPGQDGTRLGGQRLSGAVELEGVVEGGALREHDGEIGLPGGDAHRRQVGEAAGQRSMSRVAPRHLAEAEVNAVDHRVHRDDGQGAGGAHDRRVVPEPAHHAIRSRPERRLECRDQLELTHRDQRALSR